MDESIERSEADYTRATALASKLTALNQAEERRQWDLMARAEEGRDREMGCDACEVCEAGDYRNCPQEVSWRKRNAAADAERALEIELVEDKLAAIGARIMRPYEHWNEDERYMEYMENRA